MYVESKKLNEGASSIAEAGTIKAGIELCYNNGLIPMIVEIDSLM